MLINLCNSLKKKKNILLILYLSIIIQKIRIIVTLYNYQLEKNTDSCQVKKDILSNKN